MAKYNKILGSIMGAAVGDAMGAATETRKGSKKILVAMWSRSSHRRQTVLPAGMMPALSPMISALPIIQPLNWRHPKAM